MAKTRNKKRRGGGSTVAMDITAKFSIEVPQAMGTLEVGSKTSISDSNIRKVKGRNLKRSKNARKIKAKARAISKNEMKEEKFTKCESKKMRTLSAKALYE